MYFMTLNLKNLKDNFSLIDFYLSHYICPELTLCSYIVDEMDEKWHLKIKSLLDQAQVSCGIHLPFIDLHAGSSDSLIVKATKERIQKALSVAEIYQPHHLIAHAGYDYNFYAKTYDEWVHRSVETWSFLLKDNLSQPIPFYLENTYEKKPEYILKLIELLRAYSQYPTGICFDIGHWFSFAEGNIKKNLNEWIKSLAPYIGHMHIHDNDGSYDQHLSPGQGKIPFDQLVSLLKENHCHPMITFEPHTCHDNDLVLEYVKQDNPFQSLKLL